MGMAAGRRKGKRAARDTAAPPRRGNPAAPLPCAARRGPGAQLRGRVLTLPQAARKVRPLPSPPEALICAAEPEIPMPSLALPFPAIDPVLIEFGPLAIRWYALAYIAGIFIGWAYMRALVRREALWNGTPRPGLDHVDDFIFWATIGVIFGGRIGFVLFYNLDFYLAEPAEIIKVWNGGMSFHGGFAGVALAAFLYARGKDFSTWSLFDLVATVAPIGLFFGRLANFINQELWGRVADVPWAVVFPLAGAEPRHPSQLYEAALEGIVLFAVVLVLVHLRRRLATPGVIAGTFVAGYGLARFFVEFFREPDAQVGYLAGGLTMGQVLSTPMILAGLAIVVVAIRRAARAPSSTTGASAPSR